MSRHRLALGGLIVAVAVLLPAPAGAGTIAGEELAAGASALVPGFFGDPGAGGSVTYSSSGTLGGGSINLGGSATVNGAGEITSFGGSFTVVGPKADISPGPERSRWARRPRRAGRRGSRSPAVPTP